MEKYGNRLFTQKELEKHINARLIRERKKNRDLELFKDMVDRLISSGAVNADSYAEAGERLAGLLASMPAGNSEEVSENETPEASNLTNDSDAVVELQNDTAEESDQTDTVNGGNENLIEVDEFPFENVEGETNDESSQTEKSLFATDLQEDVPLKEGEDLKLRFSKLCEELEKFIEDMTSLKSDIADDERIDGKTEEKVEDDSFIARRNFSSTGFSSRSATDAIGSGFELTPMQRDIARRAGISYREYAELLREIPENNKKRRQYR